MSVKATKTRKRLVLLLAAVLGTVGAAGGLWAVKTYRSNARFAQARETGMRAAAEGRSAEAVSHLAYWLYRNPDDVEALKAYAKHRLTPEGIAADKDQRVWEAVTRLRHLVELRPDEDEPRRQLMQLYARYGLVTEMSEAADAILNRQPNDVEALRAKMAALSRLRRWDEALALAERWSKAAPDDPEVTLGVLMLMSEADKPGAEIVARAKAGAPDPNSPISQMLVGVAYALTDDLPSAQNLLRLAAKQKPPTPAFARLLTIQLNRTGLHEESLKLLIQLAQEMPDDADVRRALLRRRWEMNESAEVLALTEKGTESLGYEAVALRALALQQAGRPDEAKQAIAKIPTGGTDPLANAWAAVVASQLGGTAGDEPRKLLDACLKALNKDSEGFYLHYFAGHAYARLDEAELAVEMLQRVASANTTWSLPLVRLSELRLAKGRYAMAMVAAKEAIRRSPNSALAAVNLARVWAASVESGQAQNADELLKLLNEIRAQLPQEETTLSMQISLMGKMGQKTQAAAAIRAVLDAKHAPTEQALLRLAAVSRAYDLGMADACFARSEQAHGMTANLAYARAIHHFSRGAADEGRKTLQTARERSAKAGDLEWSMAWARYLEVTRDPAAKDEWIRMADGNPEDRQIQQLVLNVQSARSDRAFIDRTIQRLRKLTGDQGVSWKVARARWTLEGAKTDQDLAQATILLKDVIRMSDDVMEPHYLLAQAYDRLNNANGAIEELRRAAAIDPANTQVALYLSRLLQKRGEFDKAREELDRVAKGSTANAEQRRQAAVLMAQQGDAKRAIELLQEGSEEGKGQNSLMLAMLHRRRNEPAKAEEEVKKLLAGNPEPVVVQFAADLYAQQGRRADADRVLAMLDKMELKPGLRELLLADHACRYDTPEKAIAMFDASIKAAPDNASAWRGLLGYYAFLGRGKELASTADSGASAIPADVPLKEVASQKDLLAEGASDIETRTLVVSFLTDPRPDNPALAGLRTIVTSRTNQETPDQTAGKLRKIVDANPTYAPLQSILAARYIRLNRAEDAIQLTSRGVQMFPNDPEPARLAVEAMAAAEKWGEAVNFAKTWRERTLANPLPADLAMNVCLMRSGQPARAAEVLAPYVADAVAKPERGGQVVFQYASALAAAGQGEKAAEVLWPLAQANGDWRKVWMQIALGLPSRPEIVRWLQRIETITPDDAQEERAVLAGAWHMLGSKTKDEAALAKANTIFESLMAKPDVSANTVVARGIAAEQSGDLAAAEAAYRRALTLDPKSLVGQNNLAMVILKRGGDAAEAVKLAKAAVDINPKAPTLFDTLALAQAKANDFDGAIASVRTAVGLEPNSLDWRLRLTRILLDAGRDKEAAKAFDEIALLPSSRTTTSDETRQQIDQLRSELSKKSVSQAQ